jgi:hypothetical protein
LRASTVTNNNATTTTAIDRGEERARGDEADVNEEAEVMVLVVGVVVDFRAVVTLEEVVTIGAVVAIEEVGPATASTVVVFPCVVTLREGGEFKVWSGTMVNVAKVPFCTGTDE